MNAAPSLTVVVVLDFNGLADTLACLETLAPQVHSGLAVLVIDNGSREPVAPAVAARFPAIATLRLDANRGWAGGNNVGINWALERGADVVCLLNNDTLLPTGSIDRLAATARRIGPCLLHPAIDYADPAEGVQLDPSTAADARPLAGEPGIYELAGAYGACLVIPSEVFRRVGLIDERFFLQMEEGDFGVRASRIGIPILCLPAVRIRHKESRAFGGRKTPLKSYYMARNRLLFTEKHNRTVTGYVGALRRIVWDAAGVPSVPNRNTLRVVSWMLMSRDSYARKFRRGMLDYVRRRFGAFRDTKRTGR